MDVNGPGTSLFQGTDFMNFNNFGQREEEEEAAEDQKKRDLELKNLLENAFNDVSIDEEGLHCDNSNNHSAVQNKSFTDQSLDILKEAGMSQSQIEFIKNCSDDVQQFNTPVRHTNHVRMKKVDFTNENESYSEQFRVKQVNGNLHDVVDASGGGAGGDPGVSLHYKHCFRTSPIVETNEKEVKNDSFKGLNHEYQEADYNSMEQLQILYEVRVREVHRLTELIDTMKNDYEIEKKDWKRQMALAQAERERYNMSQSQLQSLLVVSKEQIEDLEKEVNTLKENIKTLEESKNELSVELETSRIAVNDLQRKVLVLEKGTRDRSEALQYEINLKTLSEKHNCELKQLQTELDSYKKYYELKNKENDQLKAKINELTETNEENLTRKSEIINRLSKQIEETQRQCEKLMKSSTSEDRIKLEMEMKILKDENASLKSKMENLEKELANQENELKQYESLSKISLFDVSQTEDSANKSKEMDYSEMNSKLRSELYRALSSQKAKRQDINNLHGLLKDKEEKIQALMDKERAFLLEAAKFREETSKHFAEMKNFEEVISSKTAENNKLKKKFDETKAEFEAALQSAQRKCQELEKENESLKLKAIEVEECLEKGKMEAMSKYNEEYLRFHNERLQRTREETEENYKIEILKKEMEMESLKKELEQVKDQYVEVFNTKENLLRQLEKEKSASGRSSVDLDEIKRLQKELDRSRHRIMELDETVRQQYQQEVEKLNSEIKHLNLQIEKVKKEKEHVSLDKEKIITENELLKTEIEQITSEKNLYFLNCEKLKKEKQNLEKEMEIRLKEDAEKHCKELKDLKNKYEIKMEKLNKELELLLTKSVTYESKYTSPMKNNRKSLRNVGTQGSPVPVFTKSTSPLLKVSTQEACTSPLSDSKRSSKSNSREKLPHRDISVLTEPEPKQIPKREVIEMMEKLGERHEDEMKKLENKYRIELVKLERKFQAEVEAIRRDLADRHSDELKRQEEKHRTEMENRIEQEKKEAVVALITEWACEVQALKHSQAEAQAELEKLKVKYKSAKNMALQYKVYFKNKTEHMKEEWKKVEDGYEKALKELEKNVHILTDVKDDEVQAKIDSITKVYEQKINKMRLKLEKCETRLKNGH